MYVSYRPKLLLHLHHASKSPVQGVQVPANFEEEGQRAYVIRPLPQILYLAVLIFVIVRY